MSLLQAALEYASLGYSVMPLKPKDKAPMLKTWIPFMERRATEEEINGWWTKYPLANVAIICGKVSGDLLVVDVDGADNPWGFDFPVGTPCQITGGGGRQWFVKMPGGRNSAGRIAQHVDTRGEGGYVCVAPSIHPRTGQSYKLTVPLLPVADLPAIPAALAALLTEPMAKTGDAAEFTEILKGVPESKRHDSAIRMIGRLFGKGLERDEVEHFVTAWNEKNAPPIPPKELLRMVDDIGKKELLKASDPVAMRDSETSDERREACLAMLSSRISIPIMQILRIEGDNPQYEFYFGPDGKKVVTSIDEVASRAGFIRAMIRGINLRATVGQKDFHKALDLILAAVKVVQPPPETTLAGMVAEWMQAYFERNEPLQNGEVLDFGFPVIHDGKTWISGPRFHAHIRLLYNYREDGRRFNQDLTRLGFVHRLIRVTVAGGKSKPIKLWGVPSAVTEDTEKAFQIP